MFNEKQIVEQWMQNSVYELMNQFISEWCLFLYSFFERWVFQRYCKTLE